MKNVKTLLISLFSILLFSNLAMAQTQESNKFKGMNPGKYIKVHPGKFQYLMQELKKKGLNSVMEHQLYTTVTTNACANIPNKMNYIYPIGSTEINFRKSTTADNESLTELDVKMDSLVFNFNPFLRVVSMGRSTGKLIDLGNKRYRLEEYTAPDQFMLRNFDFSRSPFTSRDLVTLMVQIEAIEALLDGRFDVPSYPDEAQ